VEFYRQWILNTSTKKSSEVRSGDLGDHLMVPLPLIHLCGNRLFNHCQIGNT